MELSRQQKILYGLVLFLAVVFLGVLVYLQFLRGADRVPTLPARPPSVGGYSSSVAASPFETAVLSDPYYQALDRSLFDGGRIPVPVPAARGKPNLF